MKIRKLKEQARRYEQEENWSRALEFYSRAMAEAGDQEESSIALLNRIGDLQVRVGDLSGAVESYEEAIERYLLADLPNNALAVCRKLERNVPGRPGVLLLMGRIRAKQGFVVDAREDFVTYAEVQLAQGDPEEAFRSLEEFASLAPEDVEIRVFLAEQLQRSGEEERAIAHLRSARGVALDRGEEVSAREIDERLDDLGAGTGQVSRVGEEPHGGPQGEGGPAHGAVVGLGETVGALDEPIGFESTALEREDIPESLAPLPGLDDEPAVSFVEESWERSSAGEATESALSPPLESGQVDSEPLPGLEGTTFSLDDGDADPAGAGDGRAEMEFEEGELGSVELAFFSEAPDEGETLLVDGGRLLEEEFLSEQGAGEPPITAKVGPIETDIAGAEDLEAGDEAARTAEEWRALGVHLFDEGHDVEARDALDRAHREFGSRGEPELAMRVVRELIFHEPNQVEHHQRLVEYAHETKDRTLVVPAYLELAEFLVRTGASRKAEAVFGQVLALDPRNPKARKALMFAADEEFPEASRGGKGPVRDYVNLGGLVLEEGEGPSFRWKVPTLDPSGDEDADFAHMLSQFKEKVAQNVPPDDAEAHYDLGSAYRDMGLLDEAIAEFQQAIRAYPHHLAAYEMLGKTFLEKGQPQMALRALGRVLQFEHPVEDELLGIYYYLAVANEEVGNPDSAREFYERVFSLDINFRDVTERLRELR